MIAVLLLLLPSQAEPYAAAVQRDIAARCGPGQHYYATANLKTGAAVQVYRRQGSWLGIRPPRGSFSWVPARQLRTTSMDDVAVARQEGVRVWVGTSLAEPNKHHWQVELRRDEPVELLGERQLVTPAGDVADTWFKIAPPAGEFRWIPADAVARRDDAIAAGQPATGDVAPAAKPASLDELGATPPPSGARLPDATEFQRVTDSAATAPPQPSKADGLAAAAAAKYANWTPPAEPIAFERLLEQLSTDLAVQVAQPIEHWRLAGLLVRAEKMTEQGPSPLHRGKTSKLAASVREFQSLYAASQSSQSGSLDSDSPIDVAAGAANGRQDGFDAEGWLMPVHSTKNAAPPFAVLDDNGRFLKLVTPAPNLNLRRYTKTRVGLYGTKSYIQSLNMPHLTAQRVVKLK